MCDGSFPGPPWRENKPLKKGKIIVKNQKLLNDFAHLGSVLTWALTALSVIEELKKNLLLFCQQVNNTDK